MFEFAVIGKGMFGSAAAKYISQFSESVLLIGPDEPEDLRAHAGVFGSYYDSGRITRILDTEFVWALAAKRSIDRYAQIESGGNEKFFHPVGCLKVILNHEKGLRYLDVGEFIGKRLDAVYERLDDCGLAERWRFLHFPANSISSFETVNAGWIDPRKMVKAQQKIARDRKVQIVSETVVGRGDSSNKAIELITDKGNKFLAEKVLVTAGGFTNFNGLIGKDLSLTPRAETTMRAEISAEFAARLQDMPSVIWFFEDHPKLHYVYVVPPVQYPDGRWYLKLGGDREADHVFTDLQALETWFHSDGGVEAANDFRERLQAMVPDMVALNWTSKPCVITDTATDRPYIGQVEERIFVAAGGCGAAAKSCDEFGRLAALSIRGEQDDSYGDDAFPVVFRGEEGKVTNRRQFHF